MVHSENSEKKNDSQYHLIERGRIIPYCQDGEWIFRDSTQPSYYTATYKCRSLISPLKEYYNNGKIKLIGYKANHHRDSLFEFYDQKGFAYKRIKNINHAIICEEYYENGKIKAAGNFSDFSGYLTIPDIFEDNFNTTDGRYTVFSNYHSEMESYNNPQKDGIWKTYDRNGKLTKSEEYQYGKLNDKK